MQNVDKFLEQLLIDKGITDLDPDVRSDLINEMRSHLMEQINKAAILYLDEQKATELDSLIKNPDFTEEEMSEFMQKSGVDFTKVTLEVMANFRKNYLGGE